MFCDSVWPVPFKIDACSKKKFRDTIFFFCKVLVIAQFEPDEWLTSQQIKAFWSWEAKRRRDELPQHNNDNPESVDVIEYMNDPDPYVDDYTSDILATVKGSNIFLDE